MSETHPVIYLLFAIICLIIAVWWKRGIVPWWYACLAVIISLVALLQHRPIQMMACAMIMAGIANLSWPYRGIRALERQTNRRSSQTLARYFATPFGTVVYRLLGVAIIIIAITNWSSPSGSVSTSAPPIDNYPAAYRQIMHSCVERTTAVFKAQSANAHDISRKHMSQELRDSSDITKDTARRVRLLAVPHLFEQLHFATLSYLDAQSRDLRKASEGLPESPDTAEKQILKTLSASDAEETKLRAALKGAAEESEEFATVQKEFFPPKGQE